MQAHKDGSMERSMTVKAIMDTWTLQMGFPVITVMNNRDGTAKLKQVKKIKIQLQTVCILIQKIF